jgi:ABC-type antimicrobial peptide transport system permease subunit
MSSWKIIFRNLFFFRRQNIGIVLAAALCAIVLTGALTVGDSVRSTLRVLAEKRVGQGDIAMLSPDGFFEEDLAVRIKDKLAAEVVVAPIALTRGTITNPDGSLRVTNVQVLGVDERFWKLAPDFSHTPLGTWSMKKEFPEWGSGSFFVNERLGKRLNMERDDRLILRMEEPSMFSRDAPLSGERDNKFITMNNPFGGILPAEGFGNFGLQGNQREPLTLFVPLNSLQKKLFRSFDEISGNTKFANFLLIGAPNETEVDLELAKRAMDKSWTLEDAGIEIKELRNSNEWSVRTRQVFLSDSLAKQASRVSGKSVGVLTYLVNAIENKSGKGDTALVPYSMMSAVAPKSVDFLGEDWNNQDIALNQWAASDLNASLGDSISVSYYTVGERRKLIESSRVFVLRKILPMPQAVPENQESDWTPRFPGLSDAESCGEWDTGIPIVHKVRDRDEDYWDEYRGTPKGFVSLKAGQEMWGNRWGSLTGLRLDKGNISKVEIKKSLRKNLHAEDAGLVLRGLRADAQNAIESPVDFGQLFMGFSFFVIMAALAITGMLFSFSLEQRSQQIGVLRAVGWKTIKIRLVYWGEGLVTGVIGSIVGVFLATIYGKTILDLLSGQWSGAVSGASFHYDASLSSMITGGASATLISLLAMVWSTRKLLKREPVELLVSGNTSSTGESVVTQRRWHKWAGIFCLISSLILAWSVGLKSNQASMAFFGAGGLFLLGGLFLFRSNLGKKEDADKCFSSLTQLHRRNLGRRAGRSLVTVGSMAAGAFLVVSTGAFRKAPPASPTDLKSGTGGFSFWGESAVPIYDDLNQGEAISLFDLNKSLLDEANVVPLRLREGDDASCLNLNKAIRPKIFGIKPSDFDGRFEFAEGNWSSLYQNPDGGAIPALVDQNTLMWALKMGMGGRLNYVDGEGKPFEVEVVGAFKGSMLQGALFIKEVDFLGKFKQQGGYRSFMLTGNKEDAQKLAVHLEDRLFQHGMEFRDSLEKLAELQKVENTYLSIFKGLGGLGMLIGTCGLGLVVVRNLVERGHEFALFEAIGYQLNYIRKNVFLEHARLAFWGIALGSVSAILGITPALFGGILDSPSIGFLWFFMALGFLAFFWVGVGVCLTLRKSQLLLLKNE